jgi:hypothetical protein
MTEVRTRWPNVYSVINVVDIETVVMVSSALRIISIHRREIVPDMNTITYGNRKYVSFAKAPEVTKNQYVQRASTFVERVYT